MPTKAIVIVALHGLLFAAWFFSNRATYHRGKRDGLKEALQMLERTRTTLSKEFERKLP